MSDSDDAFEDDPGLAKQLAEDFEHRREALFERLFDFMDEEGIDETYLADLLFDAAVNMRMTAYGWGVENPSATGLKLDLDRVARDVADMVREAKKRAEDFISELKDKRLEAEARLAEEGGPNGEGEG